ncbi:hypothetical protein [Nonomuraea sp. NPDC049141]|uniref:helix-turn-helix transcriptional regulator n=1 Tax=Nonomuraea sp. NPDC049141 TaxID=3155500 RepID=UPI0033F00240
MAASTRRNQPGSTRPARKKAVNSASIDDKWITVPEILEELKIDRRTWQHWVTRGCTPEGMIRLPSGRYRIPRDHYRAWLASLEVDA